MKPSRPVTYRQRDLAAAMRAAKQTGFPVRKIYIDREGQIIIEAGEPEQPAAAANEWDALRDKI